MRWSAVVRLALAISIAVVAACGGTSAGPVRTLGGKTVSGVEFSIELPASMRQNHPTDPGTFVDTDRTVVRVYVSTEHTMDVSSPETFLKTIGPGELLVLATETFDRGFALLVRERRSEILDTHVLGFVVHATGTRHALCMWTVSADQLEGKTLPRWSAMTRACRSIRFVAGTRDAAL